jgi:hypothetical protein
MSDPEMPELDETELNEVIKYLQSDEQVSVEATLESVSAFHIWVHGHPAMRQMQIVENMSDIGPAILAFVKIMIGLYPESADADWEEKVALERAIRREVTKTVSSSKPHSGGGFDPSKTGGRTGGGDGGEFGPPRPNAVDCSVFAPPKVYRGQDFLIQVFLHKRSDLVKAARLARNIDKDANRRGFSPLSVEVERGSTVEVFLESPELEVREPYRSRVWDGKPLHFIYSVRVFANTSLGSILPVVHIAINGVPVGEIEITLSVEQAAEPESSECAWSIGEIDAEMPRAQTCAIRYEQAFISYSRKDFQPVSLFAQGLAERSMRVSIDITELEPGDDWAKKLYTVIEQSNVFYLMWSDNAAKSEWVEKESRYAVALNAAHRSKNRPRIKPIVLHQPVAEPPDHLAHLHFNSLWLAHRTAQQVGLFRRRGWWNWMKSLFAR